MLRPKCGAITKMKYEAPSTAPESFKEYQLWLVDELRHLADAMVQLETDAVLLKEWNVEPDKLYNGLVAYADGTNWDPGDGRGLYLYNGNDWELLSGGGGFVTLDTAQEIDGLKTFNNTLKIIDGNPLHIEGTVDSEFLEITVDSDLNAVKMLTSGMNSGALRGWWFEQPVRLRSNTDLFFYTPDVANNLRLTLGSEDFNILASGGAIRDFAIIGLTERVKDGVHALMQIRAYTTAALVAIGNIINTSNDKIVGYMLFNVTTGKPVWSLGPNANSLWVDATGATVHTPA